jgi:S1-C subfamily serine protease
MRTGWEQRIFVPIETSHGVAPENWPSEDEGDVLYVTPPPSVQVPRRMGVSLETENPPVEGLAVTQVTPGSPAAAAGVQTGDVLLRLDGRPLPDLFALKWFLETAELGRSYRLEILRGGDRITTALVLPTRPPHPRRMPRP